MQYIQIYGLITHKYWDLTANDCKDTESQSLTKITSLIKNSVKLEVQDLENISIIYPDNINSYILASICKKHVKNIKTFTYNKVDDKSKGTNFIKILKKNFDIDNYNVISDSKVLHSLLIPAMMTRDMPGMPLIDTAYLEFLSSIKETGEEICISSICSNELLKVPEIPFPLCLATDIRSSLINKELADEKTLNKCIDNMYNEMLKNLTLDENNYILSKRYINIKWYISSILERMDTLSSSIDINVYTPYLDYRLVEYIYNAQDSEYITKIFDKLFPDIKINGNKTIKELDSSQIGILEHEVKKILNDSSSKLLKIIDKKYVQKILSNKGNDLSINKDDELISYAGLLSYLIQIEYWLNIYEVELEL